MKTRIAILAACLSVLVSTAAGAVPIAVTALTGADLVVRRSDGSVVTKMQTDDRGQVTVKGLAPGDYVIEIDGKSLIAAMDRLAPPPPAKHDNGPSVSLGAGGRSDSHRSGDHGAGPVEGSHGSSTGAAGIAALGVFHDGYEMNHTTIVVSAKVGGMDFSSTTSYRRETADRGVRMRFTVPKGSGAQEPRVVGISVGASW